MCRQERFGLKSVELYDTSRYLVINFKRFRPVY